MSRAIDDDGSPGFRVISPADIQAQQGFQQMQKK